MSAWERKYDEEIQDYHIFKIRRHTAMSPRTGKPDRYVTLEAPDWVNVVAITGEGKLILVRQYRHGVDNYTLEIPAGMVEPGEDPLAAMRRELAEETGFVSDRWTKLGSVSPNPAYQGNLCHHYLAMQCGREGEQQLDAGEDIAVIVVPIPEVALMLREGTINHALAISAFFGYLQAGQPGGVLI
jgi:ADP-ribose pyrophosphatase